MQGLNFLSGVSLFISTVVLRMPSPDRLASAEKPPAFLNGDFFFCRLERRFLWRLGELYLLLLLLSGEFLFLGDLDFFESLSMSTWTKSSIPENWHIFFFFSGLCLGVLKKLLNDPKSYDNLL